MTDDEQLARAMRAVVDAGALAGVATLVWRRGEVVHRNAVGWRSLSARVPLQRDDLFRIASMTKPVTSMAALMLLEEGRVALEDPLSRWAPELARLRVLRAPTGPLDDTRPAERPITIGDLLTHRSGLTYGAFWPGPLARAHAEALGGDIDSPLTPDQWIAALGTLPLVGQPGLAFHYGHSTDLLGLLIARIEGAPLGEVLARRIFKPLGMKDTGFTVPDTQRARCVEPFGFDENGRLAARQEGPGGSFSAERPTDWTFVSGGQGLWSTLDDYLRFARLFVQAGEVDGVRLLRPDTLALMTSNRLSEEQRTHAEVFGRPVFGTGHGFGLGVAVVLSPEKASPLVCGGGVGAVGWPGGFGSWWQADPNDCSILLLLSHNMVELDQLANGVGFDVYEAIMQFHALATALPR
jgi:CubicO group peptidase (beta-lactamase class C family)